MLEDALLDSFPICIYTFCKKTFISIEITKKRMDDNITHGRFTAVYLNDVLKNKRSYHFH